MSTLASVTAAAAGPLIASQFPPATPVAVQPPPSAAAPPPVARAATPGPDTQSGGNASGGYAADGSATPSGGRSLIDIQV